MEVDGIRAGALEGGVDAVPEVPVDEVVERRVVTPVDQVDLEPALEELADDAPVGPEVEDRRLVLSTGT